MLNKSTAKIKVALFMAHCVDEGRKTEDKSCLAVCQPKLLPLVEVKVNVQDI